MALALAGCIVAGPPDYKDPTQTPPLLDLSQALPLIGEVQAVSPDDQVQFNVPVRSEDAGDGLTAALYLDGLGSQQLQTAGTKLAPSTFDDVTRIVKFTWTVPSSLAPKCHRLTLLVTHSQHFDFFATPTNYTDPNDVALATWWLNVADQIDTQHPNGTNTLHDCPQLTGATP